MTKLIGYIANDLQAVREQERAEEPRKAETRMYVPKDPLPVAPVDATPKPYRELARDDHGYVGLVARGIPPEGASSFFFDGTHATYHQKMQFVRKEIKRQHCETLADEMCNLLSMIASELQQIRGHITPAVPRRGKHKDGKHE